MIKIIPQKQDDTVALSLSGSLSADDYDEIIPLLKHKIATHKKINLYCEVESLNNVDPAAVWHDMKVDVKHLDDFRRVAIVGDEKWMKWMAQMAGSLTTAQVKFFTEQEKPEAIAWVVEDEDQEEGKE